MFDIIIIGAGPAGYEGAAIAAQQGKTVLLIEADELGGTCLNRGCIPTKTFCRSADAALDIADAAKLGIKLPEGVKAAVDMVRVVERKNAVVAQLRQGVEMAVAKATVVKGTARFVGPRIVEVEGADGTTTRYEAAKIIIATGSRSASLPIAGAELCLSSTEMLDLQQLPKRLVIIGGGVIGMEFASIFAAFGVEVTVVEYCKEILPPFDKDIAKRLRTALQKRGVTFYLSAQVTAVEEAGHSESSESSEGSVPSENPRYAVKFLLKGKEAQAEGDMVLMAVGRRAVVPEGLTEHTSATIGRRGIEVDAEFQTAEPGVYAVGDCNGRCMLAHAASAQAAHVVGEKVNLDVVPSAVFTVPECAMVGITEEQAKESGREIRTAKIPMRSNGKALAMDEADGLVKMIVDASSRQILGCSVCAPHAADLVAEVALAMAQKLPVDALTQTIHSHPSLTEAILAAARAIR